MDTKGDRVRERTGGRDRERIRQKKRGETQWKIHAEHYEEKTRSVRAAKW